MLGLSFGFSFVKTLIVCLSFALYLLLLGP